MFKLGGRNGLKVITAGSVTAFAFMLQGCVPAASGGGVASSGDPSTPATISQADKAEGAKAHPQLLQEFGGAVTGSQAAYVEKVGKGIAMQSGLGNARSDFTVTLLNSSVNNAFAIPGGYVYVTRQLTALMNNEAQLAAVLGHEVGHVAARHSAKRQQAASRNQLLGDSAFGRLGQQVFSQGSQMLTLKYSRSQELEADDLGIAYLQRAGYDPRAMSTVLESLARQNALEAQLRGTSNQVPEWASTHPDPASRVRDALAKAGANATGITNRDGFLTNIDGLIYGDDPKQGIIDGSNFTHPVLRLSFQAPDGYYMVNGTQAVSINGGSGKAQFSGGNLSGSLDAYIDTVFASLTDSNQTRITPANIEKAAVNGIPAAYGVARVQASNGPVDVTVFAYDFGGGKAYHFVTITQAGQAGVFNPMFKSFQRISAAQAGSVKPRMLDVVTVKPGDTVQSLAGRMAYSDAKLERFLVLNGLQSNSTLQAGQKIKIISY